ncbi:MAG: SIMPL domain-containing protein [Candidatus Hydrothermia bacterium]
MNTNDKLLKGILFFALILGAGLIASTLIISFTLYGIKRMDNTITVTGSARARVSSDQVKWTVSISRIAPTLNEGYNLMARDLSLIKEYLEKSGINSKDIEISQIYTSQPWLYTERSDRLYYQFTQELVITSNDLDKIEQVSKKVYDLVGQGVNIVSSNLEFYYSRLPELRINLLNEAMQDAKRRAVVIAKSTGRKVGKVKSSKMGVVQVMAPNSVEISDYGAYNTRTREKEVMITVQSTFYLR